MRNARRWERLLGVERTVVDGVVFDEDEEAIAASVRPRRAPPGAAASASAAARAMTTGRALDLETRLTGWLKSAVVL